MSIKCGHCQGRHETVRDVRQCAMSNGVSAGSIAEQNGLVSSRPGYVSPEQAAERRVAEGRDTVNRQNGHVPSEFGQSGHVPNHGAHGGPVATRTKTRAAEGMYRKAGSIYKVQKAVHGSGQNYAKRLVETATIDRKTGKPKWKFEYAPGFVYELRPEHMLTLEQAREFGALYGTCCVCGRTLTNEESIAAGIGPICAEKF